MSSIVDDTHPKAPMKRAISRTYRFNLWGAIAFLALFGVLAVKAQILPAPTWIPLHFAAETTR